MDGRVTKRRADGRAYVVFPCRAAIGSLIVGLVIVPELAFAELVAVVPSWSCWAVGHPSSGRRRCLSAGLAAPAVYFVIDQKGRRSPWAWVGRRATW